MNLEKCNDFWNIGKEMDGRLFGGNCALVIAESWICYLPIAQILLKTI